VEGERRGPDAGGFPPRGRGPVVVRGEGPGRRLGGGGVRGGGGGGGGGGVPRVAGQHLLQVGFGLLQLRQRGVDLQRARQLHVQLGWGGRRKERR